MANTYYKSIRQFKPKDNSESTTITCYHGDLVHPDNSKSSSTYIDIADNNLKFRLKKGCSIKEFYNKVNFIISELTRFCNYLETTW